MRPVASCCHRLTWIDRYVPFDIAVPFHMMVAIIGGLLALMHTFSHIADYLYAVSRCMHATVCAALWLL